MSAHRPSRHPALPAPPHPRVLLALVCAVLCGVVGTGLPAGAVAAPGGARTGASTAVSTDVSTARSTASSTARPATSRPATVPSPSADEDGATAPGETGEDAAVSVRVMSVSPQVVRPEDELTVRATVRNDTDQTLDSPRVTLRISRFLRSTRSSLQQWVDQSLDGTAGTPIETVRLPDPLAPGASVDVELRVPAAELGLSRADSAWGPRGISVEATDGGRREGIRRTFVLWQPTEQTVAPTRVTVLVPLTGGPVDPTAVGRVPDDGAPPAGRTPSPRESGESGDSAGSGDSTGDPPATDAPTDAPGTAGPTAGTDAGTDPGSEPTTGTDDADPGAGASPAPLGAPTDDDLDRLEDVLDATGPEAGVSWAVDPALLTAARSPGATPRARRWADDLSEAAAGRDVVALPARDPDLAALAHGGGDPLAAEAYARARATADPVLGATPPADLAWPAADVPDQETVALAARSGATAVVVGGDALETDRLTYTPTGRATVPTPDGDVAALVADPVLGAQLVAPPGTTAATAAQRILAETAVLTRERPSDPRHLLVTAPRGWDPEPRVAGAQLTALATAPWVDLVGLSELVATPDPGLARAALPERQVGGDEISPGEITALLTARAELAAFAAIVPDPSRLLTGVDDAVLAPTSVGWRVDPVQRSLVVDAVVADLAARRSGVSVVPGSSLNLISETGRFPLGLRNDLAQDVTVQVAIDPASPVLVIDEAPTVTIPAGSETQVRVPFHAVGSGDVRVTVSLLSPDGVPLGAPQQFTVRVRADWENVGTAVVAGLLGLALVVGIVRTIRRGQTRHRGAGSTPVSEIAALPEEAS